MDTTKHRRRPFTVTKVAQAIRLSILAKRQGKSCAGYYSQKKEPAND